MIVRIITPKENGKSDVYIKKGTKYETTIKEAIKSNNYLVYKINPKKVKLMEQWCEHLQNHPSTKFQHMYVNYLGPGLALNILNMFGMHSVAPGVSKRLIRSNILDIQIGIYSVWISKIISNRLENLYPDNINHTLEAIKEHTSVLQQYYPKLRKPKESFYLITTQKLGIADTFAYKDPEAAFSLFADAIFFYEDNKIKYIPLYQVFNPFWKSIETLLQRTTYTLTKYNLELNSLAETGLDLGTKYIAKEAGSNQNLAEARLKYTVSLSKRSDEVLSIDRAYYAQLNTEQILTLNQWNQFLDKQYNGKSWWENFTDIIRYSTSIFGHVTFRYTPYNKTWKSGYLIEAQPDVSVNNKAEQQKLDHLAYRVNFYYGSKYSSRLSVLERYVFHSVQYAALFDYSIKNKIFPYTIPGLYLNYSKLDAGIIEASPVPQSHLEFKLEDLRDAYTPVEPTVIQAIISLPITLFTYPMAKMYPLTMRGDYLKLGIFLFPETVERMFSVFPNRNVKLGKRTIPIVRQYLAFSDFHAIATTRTLANLPLQRYISNLYYPIHDRSMHEIKLLTLEV